jgi:VWFA-related protein
MNLLRRSRFSLFCLTLSVCALPAAAQQSGAIPANPVPLPSKEAPAQTATDHRIVLDVGVTDKSGQPIRGLQKQDFTVLDNKAPATITGFEAVEAATGQAGPAPDASGQIILLLDEVNTTFTQVSRARDDMERFLRQHVGPLPQPAVIAFLSDTGGIQVQEGSEPSSNPEMLINQLKSHDAALRDIRRSAGFYGAVDRFQLSLRALAGIANHEEAVPGRKTLIWVSPGWPILSGPGVQLDSKQEQGLFNSMVELSESLRRARITLYSIDPLGTADAGGLRTFYYENFLKGVEKPQQMQAGNLALQVFATHSGGRVFSGSNDVASEIAASLADAASLYTLSFNAPAGEPGRYHAIQVNVARPGLKVRTSSGYYSQP